MPGTPEATHLSTPSCYGKGNPKHSDQLCSKQLKCSHTHEAVDEEAVLGHGGKSEHLWVQHRGFPHLPPILTTVTHRAAMQQLPSSNLCVSQTLPVSTGNYFQPSRFLSICSRNPLAILCPDGRLQMKGTGSWRVFSWPASQQLAGTYRHAESCTDKALLHCKNPSIPL